MKYLILFLFSFSTIYSQSSFEIENKKTGKIIEKYKKQEDLPGISVSISYNDTLIFSEGFGFADIENNIPVYPNKTQFDIGSCTKMFTAVSLAHLVESDSLKFEDSVYKHLANLDTKDYDMTLEQLASHTSGLARDTKNEDWEEIRRVTKTNFFEVFKTEKQLFLPQSKYLYSNLGYKILGLVIEEKSGLEIDKANKKFIFNRLNMNFTQKDSLGVTGENIAKFYPVDRKNYHSFKGIDCTFMHAEGCYLSTSEDLIKFGNGILFPNRLLKKETLIKMIKSQRTLDNVNTKNGIGFETKKDSLGNQCYGHVGNWVGSRSYVYVYPNSKLVIVLLANRMLHTKKYNHKNVIPEIASIYINKITSN